MTYPITSGSSYLTPALSNKDVMNRKLTDMINDDRDHDTVDTGHHSIITIKKQQRTESTDENNNKLKEETTNEENSEKNSELERNTVIIQRWWRQRQLVLHTLLIYGMDKVGIVLLSSHNTINIAG